MTNRLQKSSRNIFSGVSIMTIVSVCILAMMCFAMNSVQETNIAEKEKTIEDLVMRSAIHCYSMEGAYPEDIEYLIENYNLNIDTENYDVVYETFATNSSPNVTVSYKESQEGGTE